MSFTLYPAQSASQEASQLLLALAPLALLSVVSRRMDRGWLTAALPWLLLSAAFLLYAAPSIAWATRMASPLWPVFAHLAVQVAPVCVLLTLVVLAVTGPKRASNQSERA